MTDRSTKPKEGTDAELVWLRGYEAGVTQMRHDHDAGWCSVAAERGALAARLAESERQIAAYEDRISKLVVVADHEARCRLRAEAEREAIAARLAEAERQRDQAAVHTDRAIMRLHYAGAELDDALRSYELTGNRTQINKRCYAIVDSIKKTRDADK